MACTRLRQTPASAAVEFVFGNQALTEGAEACADVWDAEDWRAKHAK